MRCWAARACSKENGGATVNFRDEEQSGRLRTATDEANRSRFEELIRRNRHTTQEQHFVKNGMSGVCFQAIREHFGCRNGCARTMGDSNDSY